MHILIAIGAAAAAAIFWIYRIQAARGAAEDLADMAGDVIGAARRLGFRRRTNVHPVDAIEDADLAAGALTVAFLDLGPRLTEESRDTHLRAMQSHLEISLQDAEEMLTMGTWFENVCNGPGPAVSRLGRQLMRLGGSAALDAPLQIINDVAAPLGGLNETQTDALHDLRVTFRR